MPRHSVLLLGLRVPFRSSRRSKSVSPVCSIIEVHDDAKICGCHESLELNGLVSVGTEVVGFASIRYLVAVFAMGGKGSAQERSKTFWCSSRRSPQ